MTDANFVVRVASVLALATAILPARAEDASCATVLDAGEKSVTTPNHQHLTQTGGPAGTTPRSSELIHLKSSTYVLANGTWHTSPLTPQDLLAQLQENRHTAKNRRCTHLRDEAVDGEPTGVYALHEETEGRSADLTVWISKSQGLYLRTEVDSTIAGAGKMHTSTRVTYRDVQAPTGAH